MGLLFSCPLSGYSDEENIFQSLLEKSACSWDCFRKSPSQSFRFRHKDWEPLLSYDLQTEKETSGAGGQTLVSQSPPYPKHNAAVKLQKVYKSFRTRRQLADCAVLVAQNWWRLLDFVELKHSSVSFFDVDKQESAHSKWSRAGTRAAKVGKGLSKNDRAQKLAFQHWLEAIDPRHRYGHNLHLYYVQWLHSKSREPFFYWLDVGEGKGIFLDKCSRAKLQQQCIKYLGPCERLPYEVVVEDGRFIFRQSREVLHTTEDSKWIFVLSTSKALYVGKKKKGTFQHSSFLAGGVTIAAGRIVVEFGFLKAVWPHSGHYRPTKENFDDFLSFLRENNVELSDVKTSSMDDGDVSVLDERGSMHLRSHSSEDDELLHSLTEATSEERRIHRTEDEERSTGNSEHFFNDSRKEPENEAGKKEEEDESYLTVSLDETDVSLDPDASQGYGSGGEEVQTIKVPAQAVYQRINSKRKSSSYQLGKQLSCKWTTGAGPRIGCVRDYPTELQFHALEQVNLSPRSRDCWRAGKPSGRSPTSSRLCAEKEQPGWLSEPVR